MIKIRLAKIGKKKDFTYRVVAIDHKSKNLGKTLEVLGRWHPRTSLIEIDKKAVEAWVAKGAQLSETVAHLMEGKTKPKKVKNKEIETPVQTNSHPDEDQDRQASDTETSSV